MKLAFALLLLTSLYMDGRTNFELSLGVTSLNVYQVLELADGNLVVSFRNDPPEYKHAVGLYTGAGKLIRWILPESGRAAGAGSIKVLGGMAQAADGALWIADADQGRFQRFDAKGKSLGPVINPGRILPAHWFDFSKDGSMLYFGGCAPKDLGALLGCKALLHRRSIRAGGQTESFIDSDRQPGWKMSELGHYRLSDERVAYLSNESGDKVAYTNLAARKVWILDVATGRDVEVSLAKVLPAAPVTRAWQDAQNAYLGRPLIGAMIAQGPSVFVHLRNQPTGKDVALVQISAEGQIVKTWPRSALAGKPVGTLRGGQIVFAYGNRLRCVLPEMIGKVTY